MTGERAVASYAEEQSGHDAHISPSLEDQPIEHDSVHHVVAQQEQGTVSTQASAFDVSGTAPLGTAQQRRLHGDTDDLLARSTTAEIEHVTSADADDRPSPRSTRPIPPPPVNLRSKPTPPSSPSFSPPPKTPFQALRVDEEECPPSPDIPPRPIPPPGRSGTCRGVG